MGRRGKGRKREEGSEGADEDVEEDEGNEL